MASCENPNFEQDVVMTRRQKFNGKTKICVKCKENTGSVVIRYAVYCKLCFFPLIQTRFKKSLDPSINPIPDGPRRKTLNAAGSLVVGLSGGTCSTAMLDLVAKSYFVTRQSGNIRQGGKDHPRNADRGIWKGKAAVCYVEVCGAFVEGEDKTDEIRAVVEGYPNSPFEFIPLRLEDSFDIKWWNKVGGGNLPTSMRSLGLDMSDEDLRLFSISTAISESSPLTCLRSYLSALPTQTAFDGAIQIFIRLLLLHTAASRQASHLLLGTSLTSLSVNLISGIAQGKGFVVSEEVKEEWTPRPQKGMLVRVIRPMRDIGMKECAIWDWWCGLRPVGGSTRNLRGGRHAIGSLTQDFIFGLEMDYPATVSTIARTCAKLAPKEASDGACTLCERPAQHGVQSWKAHISIRSYSEASFAVSGNARPPHLTEQEISNLTKPASNKATPLPSLNPHLCYACHTLLTSRSSRGPTTAPLAADVTKSSVPLPVWVQSTMNSAQLHASMDVEVTNGVGSRSEKWSRDAMKAQIGGFLLSDD